MGASGRLEQPETQRGFGNDNQKAKATAHPPSGMTTGDAGCNQTRGLQAGLQFAAFRFEEGVADTVDDR